jgi:hypothetical protein
MADNYLVFAIQTGNSFTGYNDISPLVFRSHGFPTF